MAKKLAAAVELGRRGGRARAEKLSKDERQQIARKGAHARASKLSAEQRKQLAKKAAQSRWKKGKGNESV